MVSGGDCGIYKRSCPREVDGLECMCSNIECVSCLAASFQLHVKYLRILSRLGIKIVKKQIKIEK